MLLQISVHSPSKLQLYFLAEKYRDHTRAELTSLGRNETLICYVFDSVCNDTSREYADWPPGSRCKTLWHMLALARRLTRSSWCNRLEICAWCGVMIGCVRCFTWRPSPSVSPVYVRFFRFLDLYALTTNVKVFFFTTRSFHHLKMRTSATGILTLRALSTIAFLSNALLHESNEDSDSMSW